MFDIKKTIEINLSQAGLEELVRKELAAQHPDVDVTAVEFKATRNPAGVEVRIDAEFRNQGESAEKVEAPKVEKTESVKKTAAPKTAPSPQPEEQSSSVVTDATGVDTATAEQSFDAAEMSAIDATLAEEEEALDADKTDAESVEETVETSGDAEVETEGEPQPEKPRKLLFPKKK
ncbi:hypothetical protein VPHK482G1_0028 [Vibrio phage K482 g1]